MDIPDNVVYNVLKTVVIQYKHGPTVMILLGSNKSLTMQDITKYVTDHHVFDKQCDNLLIVDEIVNANIYKP